MEGGRRMRLTILLVARSMATSLGPPGRAFLSMGEPVSRTQRRSAGSTTTDCTETKWVSFLRLIFVLRGLGCGSARPVVDGSIGEGDGFVVDDFRDGEGNVVTPAGKVDEDAVGAGDGDAGRHGAAEGCDRLKVADGCVLGEALGRGLSGKGGGDARQFQTTGQAGG